MSLKDFVACWGLVADGEPFRSHSSDLPPVLCDGEPAMLKVPFNEEERFGSRLMRWWNGEGAARVLRFDEPSGALVLERAMGVRRLAEMAERSEDDAAIRILCGATYLLHRPRREPWPSLVPLREWFEALPRVAASRGGIYAEAWKLAGNLLDDPQDIVPLHGDVHHGNVLDFGRRGWLAIDPKHIFGERTFDYVNMLRNPDPNALPVPERFRRHARIIAQAAGLDRRRLMRWTYAFAGLSAAWIAEDGDDPRVDLAIARLAGTELGL